MRVIDLFCGAGGFSLGFQMAGHEVVLGIDNWGKCEKTYRANHPDSDFWLMDVDMVKTSRLPPCDIIIGSPPCPDFSLANRNRNPERGMVLVHEYERIVAALKPKWFIMENVPQVRPHISGVFYPTVRVLNAADFGVPQIRRRCFAGNYAVPRPSHARSPSTTLDGKEVKPWVTVREAIGDFTLMHLQQPSRRKKTGEYYSETDAAAPSPALPDGKHDILKVRKGGFDGRNGPIWYGIDSPSMTVDATSPVQVGEDDTTDFMRRRAGKGGAFDPILLDFDKPTPTVTTQGTSAEGERGRANVLMVRIDGRAGYLKDGPNADGRKSINEPSYTIRGHGTRHGILQPFKGRPSTTIQGDPRMWPPGHHTERKRTLRRLTIHECARLQSFPDSFEWVGTKTAVYRMVGNAVPPLMARALAEAIGG